MAWEMLMMTLLKITNYNCYFLRNYQVTYSQFVLLQFSSQNLLHELICQKYVLKKLIKYKII